MSKFFLRVLMLVFLVTTGCSSSDGTTAEVERDDEAATPTEEPDPGTCLSVFIRPDESQETIDSVEAEILQLDTASDVVFFDTEASYERFQDLFTDSPDLQDALGPGEVPISFMFNIESEEDRAADTLGSVPGVLDVIVSPFGPCET